MEPRGPQAPVEDPCRQCDGEGGFMDYTVDFEHYWFRCTRCDGECIEPMSM